MNKDELTEITAIFKENGYSVVDESNKRIIQKRGSGGPVGFFMSVFIGLVVITFGLTYHLHYSIVLSGFFFIGFPILFDRWRYPRKIIMDNENHTLNLISGFTYRRTYRFSDITGLNVDENILSSDTSPFKEGYRDFIYSFGLKVANSQIKFIKFLYRTQSETKVEEIFKFLAVQLKINKAS